MRGYVGLIAALLAGACAPAVRSEAAGPLAGTLAVEVMADTAWLTLNVTNATAGEVRLEYPTAQRYDFEIRTPAGAVVWQWSADRMFAQVVSEERLAAGETVRYRAGWRIASPGDYVAVGRLTSTNERVELSTSFRVTGEPAPAR